MSHMHRWGWPFRIVAGVVFGVAIAFLLGWVIENLWNALIPQLFHGPVISYWQAIGLFILSHLLLRGHAFGHHKGHRHGSCGCGSEHYIGSRLENMTPEKREKIKRYFEEELANMPPEKRERALKHWGSCCGWKPEDEKKEA